MCTTGWILSYLMVTEMNSKRQKLPYISVMTSSGRCCKIQAAFSTGRDVMAEISQLIFHKLIDDTMPCHAYRLF